MDVANQDQLRDPVAMKRSDTSTVGLPRESMISLPLTAVMLEAARLPEGMQRLPEGMQRAAEEKRVLVSMVLLCLP